jgi:FkbM family methyltransferase
VGRQKPYWYYLLKFSWPGRVYTRLLHPGISRQAEEAKQYYKQVLPETGGTVFDIGANVGDLSAVFLSMGFTVVACEPDAVNFTILKARFSGYKNIYLLQKAVAHQNGAAILYQSAAHGGSLSTLSIKRKQQLDGVTDEEGTIRFDQPMQIGTISLDEMIESYGWPCFIKIDVEGYEQEVLAGLTQPVPLLSFEANLPEFLKETMACLNMLKALDNQAVYNASTDDLTLVFDQFQSFEIFFAWFKQQEGKYAEIFCRMASLEK